MADPEQLAILRDGVDAWNAWRRRQDNSFRADLREANLGGADLFGANLSKANFTVANLTRAHFGGANLSAASCYETVFSDTTIVDAQGLDEIRHDGPSTLDHRTFENSPDLPDVFLRGVGLPDWLIDSYRGYTGKGPINFYSCFISYSHSDKSFARRLHDQLQGRGIRCWLDEHQLLPGDNIYKSVDRGIRLWDKVLLCCSDKALSSRWVKREIDHALEKEAQLYEKHGDEVLALIPLNLDGTLFGWEHEHATTIRRRLAPDFTEWGTDNAKFDVAFEKLVLALRADDGGREQPPTPKL